MTIAACSPDAPNANGEGAFIGEDETDDSMPHNGRDVGEGAGPECRGAVDPVDGPTLRVNAGRNHNRRKDSFNP